MAEELAEIPSIYITKEGGISVDEAMQELRDRDVEINSEYELAEYLQNLEKTNVKIPLLADLNNFLATLRKKQFGRNMNLGELAAWCLDHCEVKCLKI